MVAMLSPFQNLKWTSICFFLFNDSSNKRTKDSFFTLSVSCCEKYSPRPNVDRYITFVSVQLKFCAITLSGNIRLNKCGISAEEWNEKFESINFKAHRISAVVTSLSLMNKDAVVGRFSDYSTSCCFSLRVKCSSTSSTIIL